jgi:hypothetical protein
MTPAIPQDDALRLQLTMIAGSEPAGSFVEIRPLDPVGRQRFIPVRQLELAAATILKLAHAHNVYVGCAPRVRQAGAAAAVERVWTLWADTDGPEALAQLRQFQPLPSMVIRTGSEDHAHAYWPLREPITPAYAQRCNRRLALALGADRKSTDSARILRPAGTLNHKHSPPRPVVCTRLELTVFTVAEVVRGLDDDPAYAPKPKPVRAARDDGPSVLAGLARVVRDATTGERNAKLNWSAYRAGDHVAAGHLDDGDAESELLAAALEVGLGEREASRTIASGLTAAIGQAA